MPNRPLNPKRLAFCREYVKDRNGTQAATRAGYSPKTASTQAEQLLRILEVKQEIGRIDAKTAKKLDLSREGQHAKLDMALEMAIATGNASAMTSAIREQNEMLGFHREKAPNEEKMAEVRSRMDAEELEFRKEYAKKRTAAESGPKPRLVKETA